MLTLNSQSASCHIYTYKEGLLSSLGHDLKLSINQFEIHITQKDPRVTASFSMNSIKVDCAIKDKVERDNLLNTKDCTEIQKNINNKVLPLTEKTKLAVFTSTDIQQLDEDYRIIGYLQLNNHRCAVDLRAKIDSDWIVVDYELYQPDYGIKPFSAMLGAIKIKPEIRIVLTLPAKEIKAVLK
jgi:hypothetical protein